MTGINFFNLELAGKTLELLRELVPAATRVAVIVNPATSMNAESMLRDLEPATHGMGLQIQVAYASTSRELRGFSVAWIFGGAASGHRR
jgi:putative ABC transport system substrate-binding protein